MTRTRVSHIPNFPGTSAEKMAVSSAQNLSLDIVQEIFKNFSTPLVIPIPDSDQKERQRRRGNVWNPFPWYLGQISSSWRTAFVSMYSDFWNTIYITADCRYSPAVWDQAVSVAKVFLERTKGHPLSFSISAKHPCPPILDLFISESMRWKDVFLCLDDEDVNIPLLRTIKNRIPQLRSLAVKIELGMPRDFHLIFEDAPALKRLSLIHLGGWHINWSMLSRLELRREFNIKRLLHVLSQTTSLEHLSFNRLTTNPKKLGEKNITAVTLSHLHTLEIPGFVILEYLTTPALKRLYMCKFDTWDPLDPICPSFFSRSTCQLQRFGCIQFREDDFSQIFPHMPDLEVMSVCDVPLRNLLDMMTCQTGQPPLLPKLRLLRCERLGFNEDKMKQMLDSRGSDRILYSVQELKVMVPVGCDIGFRSRFKHPNFQARLANRPGYEISTQFSWICDDHDFDY